MSKEVSTWQGRSTLNYWSLFWKQNSALAIFAWIFIIVLLLNIWLCECGVDQLNHGCSPVGTNWKFMQSWKLVVNLFSSRFPDNGDGLKRCIIICCLHCQFFVLFATGESFCSRNGSSEVSGSKLVHLHDVCLIFSI